MKLCRASPAFIAVLLSISLIYGNELMSFQNLERLNNQILEYITEGSDVDKSWGAINSDSVRIGPPMMTCRNGTFTTVRVYNITFTISRIMDGIRLRSINNTGIDGEIIDGGIGYNYVEFMLTGKPDYSCFVWYAYENYTSSLIPYTTPAPIPDKIIEEWGVVNYASKNIPPFENSVYYFDSGVIGRTIKRINTTSIIDGIRLISVNNTIESGEILQGGIGYNYAIILVGGYANYLNFEIQLFKNGTYFETREIVYGRTYNWTKLEEKRFQNYPASDTFAKGNATFSAEAIFGIRLTYLNYTDGQYVISKGGINENSVTFEFSAVHKGQPYDFMIEIFGNNSIKLTYSKVLFITSLIILFILFE